MPDEPDSPKQRPGRVRVGRADVGRAALAEVLETARETAQHTTDLGNRFERLAAAALTAHDGPNGAQRFRQVWLWSQWPGRDSHDIGVDLVAEQTEQAGGGLVAIQCKFYQGQVSTKAVDSFLAASGRPEFASRILMTTGSGVQDVGAAKLRNAYPPCEIFDLDELAGWHVDWWHLARAHHVVAAGAQPQPKPPSRWKRTRHAYIASLRRRWAAAENGRSARRQSLLRAWLVIEAALVGAVAVAAAAAAAAGVLLIALFAALGASDAGRKPRRRRR